MSANIFITFTIQHICFSFSFLCKESLDMTSPVNVPYFLLETSKNTPSHTYPLPLPHIVVHFVCVASAQFNRISLERTRATWHCSPVRAVLVHREQVTLALVTLQQTSHMSTVCVRSTFEPEVPHTNQKQRAQCIKACEAMLVSLFIISNNAFKIVKFLMHKKCLTWSDFDSINFKVNKS